MLLTTNQFMLFESITSFSEWIENPFMEKTIAQFRCGKS